MRAQIFTISILLLSAAVATVWAQAPTEAAKPAKLADLVAEAERENPRILAARQAWQAATRVPSQVATLPDPQFMVQQFSVGSPRPFAGYTNSDFAYLGLGVSQDFPYPGKLRLRGEAAKSEAEVARERYEAVRRSVAADLKTTYFQIAYLEQLLSILDRDGHLLEQVEGATEARYRAGQGNQQDVLQAQLQKTKLLREVTERRLELGRLEAQIKQLLNRPQSSPDIATEPISETPLSASLDQLQAAVKTGNPDVLTAQKQIQTQNVEVEIARKDFYPDFNLQYMWQRTDPTRFRAYYMLTFGVRIPIYRGRKQQPELAQAKFELERSRSEYEAQQQQTFSQVRDQFLTVQSTARLLKIYSEGLVPQALASFDAGLAAYQANRQEFASLLTSFKDVLQLDEEYAQNLAEHETALAQLEALTGLPLR